MLRLNIRSTKNTSGTNKRGTSSFVGHLYSLLIVALLTVALAALIVRRVAAYW